MKLDHLSNVPICDSVGSSLWGGTCPPGLIQTPWLWLKSRRHHLNTILLLAGVLKCPNKATVPPKALTNNLPPEKNNRI